MKDFNWRFAYLTLSEVNEMLDDPLFIDIYGDLMKRKKELIDYRNKMMAIKEQEEIEEARKRETYIEPKVEKIESKYIIRVNQLF